MWYIPFMGDNLCHTLCVKLLTRKGNYSQWQDRLSVKNSYSPVAPGYLFPKAGNPAGDIKFPYLNFCESHRTLILLPKLTFFLVKQMYLKVGHPQDYQ